VLFDFFGFGLSSKPDVRYSIRMYADQAERVARNCGLESVVLVTHDMGDTVGGELLARDLDGDLDLDIEARVLTNGSIYIDMAHLTRGQEMLLALDDARVDLPGDPSDPGAAFKAGLGLTFAPAHAATADELDAQWTLVAHNAGNTLLARTIRYIEDRRAEEARFTGAIERHPSPVGVVWGAEDPVAVLPMTTRFLAARPGTPLAVLDGVGHYPMVEAPDAFTTALFSVLGS
jgi:pimeloyl-ACP methyl ester carboxylesterase